MQVLLSPAKNLDTRQATQIKDYTLPVFTEEAKYLINQLKKLDVNEISRLMNINHDLAGLNKQRYAAWHLPFDKSNAKEALLTFDGEVFKKMNPGDFDEKELHFAQDHFTILSGLYGALRPLDLMQPYRLEMGTKLSTSYGKNLYEYWGHKITGFVNERLSHDTDQSLVNLASQEYTKAITFKNLHASQIITPVFKDHKNGKYQVIFIFAKQMRGKMSRFIIKNQPQDVNEIKLFSEDGYAYDDNLSSDNQWVFTR